MAYSIAKVSKVSMFNATDNLVSVVVKCHVSKCENVVV